MDECFCSEIEVLWEEKFHIIYVMYKISDSRDKQKRGKIESMT